MNRDPEGRLAGWIYRDKDAWLQMCRDEARKQWCYAGLIDDHPEHVEHAWHLDEDPKAFVQWLGEKYDLTPYNDGNW